MKKYILLFTYILLGGVTICIAQVQNQQGVGIEKINPTETLHVGGTLRVDDLPQNGTKKAINTKKDGTRATSKSETFKAVKAVVVDENGVVGTMEGLPVIVTQTETETTRIKLLRYGVNSVPINAETPVKSETCLDNICVRLNETSPNVGTASFQYKVVGLPVQYVNGFGEKYGSGGGPYVNSELVNKRIEGEWYTLKTEPNVRNQDMARYTLAFLNSQQMYRINVSCTPGNIIQGGNVTIFIERMGYND